ncbi:MAG: uracil-DNA glycosylase [Kiritimatiellae bacterium]|nr:uracil-DNA glycosylase [Kiritimatiellia bacterium]
MDSLKDVVRDLRSYVDLEIQSGRRRQPLDRDVVEAFLAGKAASGGSPAAPAAPAVPPPPSPALSPSPAPVPRPAASPAPVGAPADASGALAGIAAQIAACKACGLADTRTLPVPGEGNPASPEVMFVGEAPGRDEDVAGRPFVGRAGKLLDKMIAAMGFAREEVFIANVVKCRPPDNRTPTPGEMACCVAFLKSQIAVVRPKTLVALGATAVRGLLGDPSASISRLRGIWTSFEGIPLMPTFHPAYLLRAPAAKRIAWDDLKLVLARLGRTPPAPPAK